jgi:tungstate transport system substrate-binding protein
MGSSKNHFRRSAARWAGALLVAVTSLSGCSAPATSSGSTPSSGDLILATTTSTQDSGLLDVLIPAFEKAAGLKVKTVAVGTGQALTMGQEGNADVLLVHAPASEKTFMDGGFGVDRRLVMNNHFFIVGPASDPAGIASATTAKDAFTKIAAASATFVSRGDGSGTETKELAIWTSLNITPKGNSWYLQSGQGMGATLQIASEKKGYTLTDDATFLANSAKLQLVTLVKNDPALLNTYHVISVNPEKWPKVNAAGAKAFSDYVTSAAGQELIGGYGKDRFGQALFTADAGKNEADLK